VVDLSDESVASYLVFHVYEVGGRYQVAEAMSVQFVSVKYLFMYERASVLGMKWSGLGS